MAAGDFSTLLAEGLQGDAEKVVAASAYVREQERARSQFRESIRERLRTGEFPHLALTSCTVGRSSHRKPVCLATARPTPKTAISVKVELPDWDHLYEAASVDLVVSALVEKLRDATSAR